MRTEGKLMLCTISELSEFLAGKIDSNCLMLISDCYCGGCANMATFFDDYNQYYSISHSILNLILDTLHCFEAATKDTLLIVEIR